MGLLHFMNGATVTLANVIAVLSGAALVVLRQHPKAPETLARQVRNDASHGPILTLSFLDGWLNRCFALQP